MDIGLDSWMEEYLIKIVGFLGFMFGLVIFFLICICLVCLFFFFNYVGICIDEIEIKCVKLRLLYLMYVGYLNLY